MDLSLNTLNCPAPFFQCQLEMSCLCVFESIHYNRELVHFVGVIQRQFVASVVHNVLGQLVQKRSPRNSGGKHNSANKLLNWANIVSYL